MQTLTYKVNLAPEGVPPVVRLSQSENGRTLVFDLGGGGIIDIPAGAVVTLSGTKPDGVVYSATGTLDGDNAIFEEDTQLTAAAGEWDAKIRITYNGKTIATIKIWFAIDSDPVEAGAVPSDSQLDGLIAEAQQYAEDARSSAYGSPLVAATAADMVDTAKVYVYTGSEAGYTSGHWYYFDGSAWEDGGPYNSEGIQTDTTLSIAGMAADSKAVGDALDDLDTALRASLSEKADLDGSYETLTAGNAGQLVAKSYTEEKAPYLFRASRSVGDRLREKIVGGTIGWNQLAQNGNLVDSTNWIVNGTIANGVATVNPTAQYNGAMLALVNKPLLASHKLLVMFSAKADSSYSPHLGVSDNVTFTKAMAIDLTSSWTRFGRVFELPSTVSTESAQRVFLRTQHSSNFVTFYLKNLIVTDLTLMLGSTIADYVYTLESATAGSGVAWLKSNGFFTRDWYSYDAGSLQSVKAGSKVNTGFNQWDEDWEAGLISVSNGQNTTGTGIRSKNFNPCIPNTTYYVRSGNNNSAYIIWYDSAKNYITNDGNSVSGFTATSPSNAHYFRVRKDGSNTYANDICISLSDPARNGEYEPYVQHVYPLDTSLTLMGVPKLSGSVMYFDGDEYADDGTVTRRYGIVDLGTMIWTYDTSTAYTHFLLTPAQFPQKPKFQGGLISKRFLGTTKTYNTIANMEMCVDNTAVTPIFRVRDDSYTDATLFKASLSGVYLVYELADPTTATADPYTNPQIVDEWGTEQFTDYAFDAETRDIPVPVGHLSKYYPNLRRRIESLPDDFSTLIAPTEAIYKATRNYTSGSLFIVNNILYKATAAIANGGTITPGTNCSATTLAAVIAAL